jgi:hypothetical protein
MQPKSEINIRKLKPVAGKSLGGANLTINWPPEISLNVLERRVLNLDGVGIKFEDVGGIKLLLRFAKLDIIG